jgi:protein TonB
MPTVKSQAFSFGLHVAVLAMLFLLASRGIQAPLQPAVPVRVVTPLTLLRLPSAREPRSGGSNHTQFPAQHGSRPPTAHRTFIPPASSDHPPLALPITIAFDIPIIDSPATDIGDPFSRANAGGFGRHGRNGIGESGCCQGIGESQSGSPGLSARRGSGITPPQLVYKVEPEFSEEARKAKFQGMVVLIIEVDANGNVRSIRVRQGLGLGLDEKAIEAVSRWRFRPGVLDGKPVTTQATVQVNFQLL